MNTKNIAPYLSTVENFDSFGAYEWSYNIAKVNGSHDGGDYIVTISDDVFNRTHRIPCIDMDQARKLCTMVAIAIESDANCSVERVLVWTCEIGFIDTYA